MSFLSLKPKAFGLDISDLSVKIVNLKKRGKFFKLASWAETEISPGVIVDGEIKKEEMLVGAIRECLNKIKGERIRTKNVIVSLPEKKAFFEIIKMPKMTEEELSQAVAFEIENYIPFSAEDVYMDFNVIPFNGGYLEDQINVSVAAMPKKIIDSYVSCLKKAELRPLVLEVESQAVCRALIKNGFSPDTILIIDFRRSRASFIIFSGYSILFTSSIPISSSMLDELIAKSLKIDIAQAERLKKDYGLSAWMKPKKDLKDKEETVKNKIAEAMIPALTDLVDQIKNYIDYYQSHFINGKMPVAGKKIEKIILSGRASNLKGLVDFLSLELDMPIEMGNPWINILPKPFKKIPLLPLEESLGYTTALGLALRGAKN
jgi:type IV pilus assembly protein PilM